MDDFLDYIDDIYIYTVDNHSEWILSTNGFFTSTSTHGFSTNMMKNTNPHIDYIYIYINKYKYKYIYIYVLMTLTKTLQLHGCEDFWTQNAGPSNTMCTKYGPLQHMKGSDGQPTLGGHGSMKAQTRRWSIFEAFFCRGHSSKTKFLTSIQALSPMISI